MEVVRVALAAAALVVKLRAFKLAALARVARATQAVKGTGL
jgi:hypothetical protein